MGTLALLLIALAAIAVLLVLVIKLEFSAYVSLLLVAMGTALVAGVPIAEVVPTMIEGMGKVLGSVAIIVGLGSMLGRMIEVSGGADALANRFTQALGPKWVIAAVTAAAFILGIPIFFDVGFIILAPIVFGALVLNGLDDFEAKVTAAANLDARNHLLDAFAAQVYWPYMTMAVLLALLALWICLLYTSDAADE